MRTPLALITTPRGHTKGKRTLASVSIRANERCDFVVRRSLFNISRTSIKIGH